MSDNRRSIAQNPPMARRTGIHRTQKQAGTGLIHTGTEHTTHTTEDTDPLQCKRRN